NVPLAISISLKILFIVVFAYPFVINNVSATSIISFLRASGDFDFFIIIIYLSHNYTDRQSTNMLCEIIANVKRYFQFTKNYSYEYTTFFELEKLKKKIPSLLNNHGILIFTLND